MITFFRKLRSQLIKENKVIRYVLYALGEIILVVIGILIALQINNNNVVNKTRELEKDYLISLKTEFETNIEKLSLSQQTAEAMDGSLVQAIGFFEPKTLDTINNRSFNQCLFQVAGNILNYEPSNGVISDIINSGKLNIIDDRNLRHQLASYNSNLALMNRHLTALAQTQKDIQLRFKEFGSLRSLIRDSPKNSILSKYDNGVDNRKLFESTHFENHIFDYYLTNKVFLDVLFPEMETTLNELVTKIENVLENRN